MALRCLDTPFINLCEPNCLEGSFRERWAQGFSFWMLFRKQTTRRLKFSLENRAIFQATQSPLLDAPFCSAVFRTEKKVQKLTWPLCTFILTCTLIAGYAVLIEHDARFSLNSHILPSSKNERSLKLKKVVLNNICIVHTTFSYREQITGLFLK